MSIKGSPLGWIKRMAHGSIELGIILKGLVFGDFNNNRNKDMLVHENHLTSSSVTYNILNFYKLLCGF